VRYVSGLLTRRLLNSLLFLPSRTLAATPAAAGLVFRDVTLHTEDGERLHAWWIPSATRPTGHVLLCHGNAGNVGDRIPHAALLSRAGFDVLLFDYRGYGRSTGSPDVQGTAADARAARRALLDRPQVEEERLLYLGESLGAAVALELALAFPPAGLVLQSAWTSIRDLARLHYPFLPAPVVPDAYPSLRLISQLRTALLVLHGERDTIVPLAHGRALFAAAPEPKAMHVFPHVGHNDLVAAAGAGYAELVAGWAGGAVPAARRAGRTHGASGQGT
jgi:pimeloyl-ACP methyl ester carboxylesterase